MDLSGLSEQEAALVCELVETLTKMSQNHSGSSIRPPRIPLSLEDSRIEKVIQQTKARLFILDPLQAYLSQDSDMFSAGRMRQQLKRLADIAAKYKCAIVVIGHMNKASGKKNLYRGLGSIDIAAIAPMRSHH